MCGPREPGRWLIYALGGGMGHLTRAIALARAGRAPGRSFRVLTNSPFASRVARAAELGADISIVEIAPALGREETAAAVQSTVGPGEFDVLVVDTFPRGLVGELVGVLPAVACAKVFVHRDLNPAYVRWARLQEFAEQFDAVIVPGEEGPLHGLSHAVRTSPWLIGDHGELLTRREARRRLELGHDDRPAVVVVGCGRAEEVASSRRLARRLSSELGDLAAVRFATMDASEHSQEAGDVEIWPLLEVMAGVDVLVGSGGYNTVQEARATGTPLVALARERLYDRQARRLVQSERADDEDDVIARVGKLCLARGNEPRMIRKYLNGAHAAVEIIERTTAGRGDARRFAAQG